MPANINWVELLVPTSTHGIALYALTIALLWLSLFTIFLVYCAYTESHNCFGFSQSTPPRTIYSTDPNYVEIEFEYN